MEDWETPLLVGSSSRRRCHVPLLSHRSIASAVQLPLPIASVDHKDGSRIFLTRCAWEFTLLENPSQVPIDFFSLSHDTSHWSRIHVPSSWEAEGHGTPIYTNFIYPIPVTPPFVPHDDNPTGLYRHKFTLEVPTGHRCFLQFDGVDSFFYVWLNGILVGFSKDSRLPAEFEVTSLLEEGENLLAVQVIRWSDASFLEDQDMWRMSGIHRDVSLLFKPQEAHIADFSVSTPLTFQASSEYSARLQVDVRLECHESTLAQDLLVHLYLLPHPLSLPPSKGIEATTRIATSRAVAKWQARDSSSPLSISEEPNLFTIILELEVVDLAGKGRTLEYESCLHGFRHTMVDPRGPRLLHNGRPIMIRGVNRHEFCPRKGKAISMEDMQDDVFKMKRAGFNAVRCSHYPNHEHWYDLCSIHGLYVVDEANIETHGFDPSFFDNETNPAWHPDWLNAMMSRVTRMWDRDKNNPCIIMWSLGNEAGYGPAHDAMAAWLRRVDPSRPVHYEGGGSRTLATDVCCPMYARIPQLRELARKVDEGEEKRPIILCEYAHSMGNSTGNLKEYWELFHSHPAFGGGFIWDWMDQCLIGKREIKPSGFEEYYAYGGDFGDKPNDAQFCANGVGLFPDRSEKPSLREAKACISSVIFSALSESLDQRSSHLSFEILISNRYDFLSLDHVSFHYQVMSYGLPISPFTQFYPQAIAARSTAKVILDLSSIPEDVASLKELWLELKATWSAKPSTSSSWLDLDGNEQLIINCQQLLLSSGPKKTDSSLPSSTLGRLHLPSSTLESSITEDGSVVVSRRGNGTDLTRAVISSSNGCLTSLQLHSHGNEPREMISSPLRPCLWRACTDNDRGGSGGFSYAARWIFAGLDRLEVSGPVELDVKCSDKGCVSVESQFTLKPRPWSSDAERQEAAARVGELGGFHWLAEHPSSTAQDDSKKSNSNEGHVDVSCTYHLFSSGVIEMEWQFDTTNSLPAALPPGLTTSLPRVGIETFMSSPTDDLSPRATWYGRGPHESYPDRKTSGLLGIYSSTVSSMHSPYVFPQESGGRADVRWCIIQIGKEQVSLAFSCYEGSPPMQMNASLFSRDELHCSRHEYELQDLVKQGARTVSLHLDALMMGVGGDDSWSPSVHTEYLVKPGIHSFPLSMALISS